MAPANDLAVSLNVAGAVGGSNDSAALGTPARYCTHQLTNRRLSVSKRWHGAPPSSLRERMMPELIDQRRHRFLVRYPLDGSDQASQRIDEESTAPESAAPSLIDSRSRPNGRPYLTLLIMRDLGGRVRIANP